MASCSPSKPEGRPQDPRLRHPLSCSYSQTDRCTSRRTALGAPIIYPFRAVLSFQSLSLCGLVYSFPGGQTPVWAVSSLRLAFLPSFPSALVVCRPPSCLQGNQSSRGPTSLLPLRRARTVTSDDLAPVVLESGALSAPAVQIPSLCSSPFKAAWSHLEELAQCSNLDIQSIPIM